MIDILEGLLQWRADGVRFALATIVRTHGSAPRAPGATMAVAETGEVLGSLSGGCVDGAVYELALEVIGTGRRELTSYGVDDGEPTPTRVEAPLALDGLLELGLTCGGVLDVLVEAVDEVTLPAYDALFARLRAGRGAVLAAVIGSGSAGAAGPTGSGARLTVAGDDVVGTLGRPAWDAATLAAVRAAPASDPGAVRATADVLAIEGPGVAPATVLVQSFAPQSRMIVFGAIDFANAVARAGHFLGHHVTVCDAREVFTTAARFPAADEVVVAWPHRYLAAEVAAGRVGPDTVVCVLTHDAKFDVPLLQVALETPARYIGVMGSRRTQADREARLREAGVSEEGIARMHSPIGLDIGARTPEETAVAIAAEIVAAATGRGGRPLADVDLPIHA